MTVVVRSGLTAGERRIVDYPERREVTRQLPAPVLTPYTAEELRARLYLVSLYQSRSEVARARLSTVHRVYTEGTTGEPARLLLNAFDAQNRAVLGVGP